MDVQVLEQGDERARKVAIYVAKYTTKASRGGRQFPRCGSIQRDQLALGMHRGPCSILMISPNLERRFARLQAVRFPSE